MEHWVGEGMGWVGGSSISYNPPYVSTSVSEWKAKISMPDSLAAAVLRGGVGVNLGQQKGGRGHLPTLAAAGQQGHGFPPPGWPCGVFCGSTIPKVSPWSQLPEGAWQQLSWQAGSVALCRSHF